jgi:hypothetical protein
LGSRGTAIGCAALAAAVLLASGCKPGEQAKPAPGASAPAAPAPAAREPSAPGDAFVELRDGLVTVECQAAPRGLVVEKLAREAGFEIFGDLDARPLTLDLRAQPVEVVLGALLEDLPYSAQWRFDPKADRHVLARLQLGDATAAAAPAPLTPEQKKREQIAERVRSRLREIREKSGSEEQKAELAARREERARNEADLLEQVRSSNPDMRMEAVAGLDPEGDALVALMDLLKNDPDARVREKAAEQAGEANGFIACAGLIDALGDREPAVVLRTLDSLEFACDETVVPIVRQRCGQSENEAVRERCAEAIEFLE